MGVASGEERPSSGRADMFSGAGLRLLLGALLGLAVTPIVAGVVGAITALLAIFLGLDGRVTPLRLPAVNALRIGAFGFATVAGLVLVLYLGSTIRLPPIRGPRPRLFPTIRPWRGR